MNNKIKTLFSTKWIQVLQEQDHDYIFAQRRNKDSVAVLCFKKNNDQYEFLVHYQPLIGTDLNDIAKLYPCPITGTLEENKTITEVALTEMYEEGGIICNKDTKPVLVKDFIPSTQINEIVHVFLFDVTSLKQTKPTTDGSYYEQISVNKWLKYEELEDLLNNEIYLSSLLVAFDLFEQYKKGDKHEN